jgi:hypothetical protein
MLLFGAAMVNKMKTFSPSGRNLPGLHFHFVPTKQRIVPARFYFLA